MRHPEIHEQVGLCFVAGYIDTLSIIAMSGLFTAHVTGDLILAAAHLATPYGRDWIADISMIVLFVLVIGLVTWFAHCPACTAKPNAWRARLFLGVELLLLIGFWVSGDALSGAVFPLYAPQHVIPVAGFAVAAMAIQYALPGLLGEQRLPTTVMTGNLLRTVSGVAMLARSRHARDAADYAAAGDQVRKAAPGLIAFFAGAAMGAPLTVWLHFNAVVVPCAALLAVMPATIRAARQG
ncbi:MAG: DUF1275 domain-containing protein [Rhodanobacteraceae bacterium]|nr:MAG: DUF1275 domain-containing protein [Rhodanobacteraceae bacterium]